MKNNVLALGLGGCGTASIGLLHCFAWNFDFPTPTERLLWRMAALAFPVAYGVFVLGWVAFEASDVDVGTDNASLALCLAMSFLLGVTELSRLYIIAEALRALCFLPQEAFLTTWASSLPQVG